MSYNEAIAKLPTPLRELVTSAAKDSKEENPEVAQWIEKVASGEVSKPERLKVCKSIEYFDTSITYAD